MATKEDLMKTLNLLAEKVVAKREKLEVQVNSLQDNETRQKIRAKYVSSKAKDVLKYQELSLPKEKMKEDAINHLVTSMDFIKLSENLLKKGVHKREVMINVTVCGALKLEKGSNVSAI